ACNKWFATLSTDRVECRDDSRNGFETEQSMNEHAHHHAAAQGRSNHEASATATRTVEKRPTSKQPEQSDGSVTIYTCPMHPQIRRPAPGNFPICGMTLEPE